MLAQVRKQKGKIERGHGTRVVCVCACEQEENSVSQLSPGKKMVLQCL